MDYVRTCQSIYGLCADLAVNIWILCKLGCQDTRVCGLLQPYIDNQHSNVLWIAHRILTLADCHDPYHGNSDSFQCIKNRFFIDRARCKKSQKLNNEKKISNPNRTNRDYCTVYSVQYSMSPRVEPLFSRNCTFMTTTVTIDHSFCQRMSWNRCLDVNTIIDKLPSPNGIFKKIVFFIYLQKLLAENVSAKFTPASQSPGRRLAILQAVWLCNVLCANKNWRNLILLDL